VGSLDFVRGFRQGKVSNEFGGSISQRLWSYGATEVDEDGDAAIVQ
jgi:hypothetical protein